MFGFGKKVRTITIDENGNVIDDEKALPPPPKPSFFASFFGSSPFNDNGREFNPASGNWEYTAEANGNANPTQINEATDDLDVDGTHVGGWWF